MGPSQLPGTKALSNCKMFGSASPACEKRAPTDLKEGIIHRQGETHGRAEPITFIIIVLKCRGESATQKLKNCGHRKTKQGLTNGPQRKSEKMNILL